MNYIQHITKNRKEAAREYVSIVQYFIRKKYAREECIDCRFDLYYHDVDNLRKAKHHKIVLHLPRIAYTQLMVVLLTYPDLTFQDLPVYIPRGLYDGLLCALYLPRYSHVYNLSVHPSRFGPIAIEMTTLQKDAREIAGEDIYTFALPPRIDNNFRELSVRCECRKLDVMVMQLETENDRVAFYSYCKIDAAALQRLLNVSDFRGIEQAWNEIYESLPAEKQDDVFWLVHWLDEHSINYVYKESFMK